MNPLGGLRTAALFDALGVVATATVAFPLAVALRPLAVGAVSVGAEIVGYTPSRLGALLLVAGLSALVPATLVARTARRWCGRRTSVVVAGVAFLVYTSVLHSIRWHFAI